MVVVKLFRWRIGIERVLLFHTVTNIGESSSGSSRRQDANAKYFVLSGVVHGMEFMGQFWVNVASVDLVSSFSSISLFSFLSPRHIIMSLRF
jgi:hypothetical protein